MKNVILYGGSFNPPTLAHVNVVKQTIMSGITFDSLYVMPVYKHAYDKALVPFAERCEMCRLAFSGFQNVHVSELDRVIQTEPHGSTYMLCKAVLEMFPDTRLTLIVGQDQAEDIGTRWYHGLDLLHMVSVIFFPRAGRPIKSVEYPWLQSCMLMDELPENLQSVSSTKAREALRNNTPTEHLLQPEVAGFCKATGLYNVE